MSIIYKCLAMPLQNMKDKKMAGCKTLFRYNYHEKDNGDMLGMLSNFIISLKHEHFAL